MNSKKNGELLKEALDALTELERRGNRQISEARQQVEFMYEDYLALKSKISALEAIEDKEDDV